MGSTSAGFVYFKPFWVLLSNIEDEKGNWLSEVDDTFHLSCYYRNDKPLKKLKMIIKGTKKAIETFEIAIPSIKKHFLGKKPESTSTLLVQLIRKAADHSIVGHFIGRNCLSTIVSPNGDFVCRDYPEKSSPEHHISHIILPGSANKYIKIWTGEGAPPWWSGNKD